MTARSLISEEYRKMNESLHESRVDYGTSGARWAPQIFQLAKSLNSKDVLDYGCGKSTLAQGLPFPVRQYDPAVPEYSAMPAPADVVVCTDVLEHIEPAMIDDVLDHLRSLTKKAGFFTICCRPANKTLPDGRNAHLIIQPPRWWLDKLWDRFSVGSFHNAPEELLVVVHPK